MAAGRTFRNSRRSAARQMNQTVPIHFSLGMSLASVGANDNLHRLQGEADAALYRAKQQGRNRIEVAL
ncbi:hypothetical protein DM872_21950 [Pseudomonas taiwanensis]|nr:hypothetical protein [Pseudomonas taiwanensis]